MTNYRPISLLSNLNKVFEKVIYNRVSTYLGMTALFYSRLLGFRKGHSTVHDLIDIVENVTSAIDSSFTACGAFVDQAFDTVDHKKFPKQDEY